MAYDRGPLDLVFLRFDSFLATRTPPYMTAVEWQVDITGFTAQNNQNSVP